MNPATVHRLLAEETARPLLAAVLPSAASARARVESVWAKPGRHCNVCWLVGDDAVRVSLCAVRDEEAARALRHAARQGRAGLVAVAAPDVLAQVFPFDYRLPQLADCVKPAVARVAFARLGLDGAAGEGADACEVVAYRAGMRCQVRFDAGGVPRAYGKTAVEREPGRRRELHTWVAAATATTAMRVPEPLGGDDATGLEFAAAVGGASLHDRLAQGPNRALVERASRAIAELHERVPAPPWREHRAHDELALLRSWADWMKDVDPSMAPGLAQALSSLADTAPAPAPPSFAHRDFHDKQVLLDGDATWMLDVDTACNGDPELDLGNLVAHLFLRGLQWDRAAAHAALEDAATAAYGPRARAAAVRWYRRATLARLACVYRLRPRWAHLAPAALDEALRP